MFHLPKEFQKFHLQIGIVVVCPKSPNSIYGTHNPLGIKVVQVVIFNRAMKLLTSNYMDEILIIHQKYVHSSKMEQYISRLGSI
jgi:hypothetical protein